MRYRRTEAKLQDAMMFGGSQYEEPTGFMENFQAAVGMTMLDNLSWSGVFWHDRKEERRRKLYELGKSGRISQEEVNRYRGYDNEFAAYLQEKYGMEDVLTDDQIKRKNQIEDEQLLGYGREVQANATFMGKVGGFFGNLPAYALDPFFAASLFIPAGHAARGATLLTRAALRGGMTAATEGALELARQPAIYHWRKDVGRDYDWKEGLLEVATAVGGAGLLGSAAELANSIRKFNSKVQPRSSSEHLMAKNLDEMAGILKAAPEGMSAVDHLKALDDEMAALNAFPKQRSLQEASSELEGSARAEPSLTSRPDRPSDRYLEGSAEEKSFDERVNTAINEIMDDELLQQGTPAEIAASVKRLDDSGDLVEETLPIKEAVKEMDELNRSFKQTWDCLFGT